MVYSIQYEHMNNFFEKLTGAAKPNQPVATFAPTRAAAATRRQAAPIQTQKPTHIKVETEEKSEPIPAEQETREEGELTVDIYDREDNIVIQSTVAGVKPEDLDVSITNDSVTIRGRRERSEEVNEESYYYKELFWGAFSRQVILPEEIEEDEAEAVLKHGMLTITLPKKRRGVVQKLKVKVT